MSKTDLKAKHQFERDVATDPFEEGWDDNDDKDWEEFLDRVMDEDYDNFDDEDED